MSLLRKINLSLCVYVVGLILFAYCRIGGQRDNMLMVIVNVLISIAITIGMILSIVKIYSHNKLEKKEDCRCYIALNIFYMLIFIALAI